MSDNKVKVSGKSYLFEYRDIVNLLDQAREDLKSEK